MENLELAGQVSLILAMVYYFGLGIVKILVMVLHDNIQNLAPNIVMGGIALITYILVFGTKVPW